MDARMTMLSRPRRRRGQAAVETLMLLPVVVVVIVAMLQLWSVTFATTNAHLRAREAALHGTTYLRGRGSDVSDDAPFSGNNYQKARSTYFRFSATAEDQTLGGMTGNPRTVRTRAVITSSF
jgi:hypothetical protein